MRGRNLVTMIFSMSLEIVFVRLMGLYEFGSPGFLLSFGIISMWTLGNVSKV